MTWLLVTISFYFILSVVFLVDKYLLTGSIPNPKVYAFYVGVLGILILVLIPFVNFLIPTPPQIILAILSGAIYVFALFWFYKSLQLFEASRVITAIGGLGPLFTFGLVYLFSFGREILSVKDGFSFILLVLGSVLITRATAKGKDEATASSPTFKERPITRAKRRVKKNEYSSTTLKSLRLSGLCAFLFSLSFILAKYVYLSQPFWSGFIWRSIGGFLAAVCFFVFFSEVRREVFRKRERFPQKSAAIFVLNQAAGGGATILQNWAIALAPLIYLSIIRALAGVQYVFLFIFTVLLSLKFPEILKEEISKKIIFQKVAAILLIGAGLAILALK